MEIKEGFIICDSYKKQEIIKKYSQDFKSYTFLSIHDLADKLLGKVQKKGILILMDKYNLSYELALEYAKYIPYVEDCTYNNLKLDSIVSAKRLLIENNLFTKDELFIYRLKSNPVTFIDVEQSPMLNRLIDIINTHSNAYFITSNNNLYTPSVYKLNTLTDEALFVFNKITDLVKNGISLNNIHIHNLDSEYTFIFKRLAKSYNIAIDLPNVRNINNLNISKQFLSLCEEKNSFKEVLELLDSNSLYYNSIFNIIVDYDLEQENPKKYISFFKEKLKSIEYKTDKYNEIIKTNNQLFYKDDDYVFYVGLNLGKAPIVYKDDQYLSDNELSLISLPTSTMKNEVSKNNLKNILLKTKNIFITYKASNESGECFKSNIIDELGLKEEIPNVDYGYSYREDYLRLGSLYSQYIKFKQLDNALEKYDLNYLSYLSFNNKYKPINPEYIQDRYNEKPLKMAYSNIKTYFECPFAYYADRILGLNEFKPNMAARLGTFSHAVLEDSYNNDFDFNKSVIKNTLEVSKDSKDKFYFSVMEEVLSSLINYNKQHEELSMLKAIEREAHIEYITDEFVFEGYIDKIMYTEINDEIYAAIIDYKTGKDYISLDNIYDGFHMQLPAYMFLLSKYEKFKNKKLHIIGIYLQKVNIISLDNTMDIVMQREKSFKLQGFTVKSHELISMLDPGYNKSDYIQSLATLKSGDFSKYSKLITSDEQNELIDLVDKLINKANKDIREAKFDIEPKLINQKNQSCTYCKYKDICYMKYDDLKELEYKPFPKVEGGEE